MGVFHPGSTYRLQFNRGFTFGDAENVLTYLRKLGIRTLYASPVFRAVSGSGHGYDVTDPQTINPEIGTEESFRSLIRALHRRNLGWLQDIVPNHMGFSSENPWIHDLLVKGRDSRYYRYFDLFHDHPDRLGEQVVMLPFLGKPLKEVLQEGELSMAFGDKGFLLRYFSHTFPLSMSAVPVVFVAGSSVVLPEVLRDLSMGAVDPDHWEERMEQLFREYSAKPEVRTFIDHCLEIVNREKAMMKNVVDRLFYLPVFWKETEQRINYRRFFTINNLICLNIQLPEVFEDYHSRILEWVEKGSFDGLRIDHVDGLYDPQAYLERLRSRCGDQTWLVVEKILEADEELPPEWPVEGTTGYDFLALVNNLLTRAANGPFFYSHYQEWTGSDEKPAMIFTEKKRFILRHRLRGELDILTDMGLDTGWFEDHPTLRGKIRKSIAEFMVHCPVYKIYRAPSGFRKEDRKLIKTIFSNARKAGTADIATLSGLEKLWLEASGHPAELRDAADNFFRRVMQFTGPLMAKGLEDTAWYAYHPFLAHNEVGDSPADFGMSVPAFHEKMIRRSKSFPLTMNALSTHDTKRGEDARARLIVLGDLPGEWKATSESWRKMNRSLKTNIGAQAVPHPADEYLIYQSLIAHLPMDGRIDRAFADRFREFLVKALREAKENTSWSNPDTAYEESTLAFAIKILDPAHPFRQSLKDFVGRIIPHGIMNSMAQTILKLTVPGVPDTYQGSERWNLSFVDPDNRRPVDYVELSAALDQMIRSAQKDSAGLTEKLWLHPEDGWVKQWVTYLTLELRNNQPELFAKGRYVPLKVTGRYQDHLIAFIRSYRDQHLLVVLPLNTADLPADLNWKKTKILLPDLLPLNWKHAYTHEILSGEGELMVKDLFRRVPFAVCSPVPNEPAKRAGILMHISSLPGSRGTGDFGPPAFDFIDFLERTGQRCWQILPLSVTSALTAHSPYSSRSAFAGNTLFIDPGQLADMGLLDPSVPGNRETDFSKDVDYSRAENSKRKYLGRAFEKFSTSASQKLHLDFQAFTERESYWIHDYALYEILKDHFRNRPWYKWPAVYRDRNRNALEEFGRRNTESLERVKFGQYIFSKQWERVKRYANERGIEIFGDIPIYVDHDSADVWAHPGLFRLKPDRSLQAVAGVPPDYFNEEGQLWGMPLYNWIAMEKEGFRWWLRRLERNLQWFDLLRLDHFRGFEGYWEIAAGEQTAKNGRWIKAPGEKLFKAIHAAYPHMPFVAEDLGQITREVYDLRDRYGLPGMKVVQFGFGEKMAFSHHYPGNIPYNSIAYTGTHDNNTIRGWFRQEADRATLKRYRTYTGKKLKEENVNKEMIRLLYGSPARLVVVPMQDWLGLDEAGRMNFPSTTEGNWLWRLDRELITKKLEQRILKMVRIFGRY